MELREFNKLWRKRIAGQVIYKVIAGRTVCIDPAIAHVDENGRLKVPAEFKPYGTQFYVTSLGGKVAKVYPIREWIKIEEKLATSNPMKKELLDRVRYYGQNAKIDTKGRLLIPQLLRKAAQIKGEVALMGNKTHLIVRNWEAYRKEVEDKLGGVGGNSDAPVRAPLKPKPHLRSGAVALPEPTHPDDGFTEIRATRISK